ncbi:MAG: CoA-binding protein [Chitinophagaceae bacterium]
MTELLTKNNLQIALLGSSLKTGRPMSLVNNFFKNNGFQIALLNESSLQHAASENSIGKNSTLIIFLPAEEQKQFYHQIVSLKPQRVIFNPGSENPEFEQMLHSQQIKTLTGCSIALYTLGLL